MASETTITRMKKLLREEDFQVFEDDDYSFYLSENDNDADAAIYQMLLIKAEDSSVTLPGMTIADTSAYFRRLAQRYRPNNSGILES